MAPSTSVLSKTLQSITLTKIRELKKQRTQYETNKDGVIASAADPSIDQRQRIERLAAGVKELYRNSNEDKYGLGRGVDMTTDRAIEIIQNRLEQSRWDASVPPEMLQSSETLLRSKLEVQSRRLATAELYSQLVTEWMSPGEPMEPNAVPDDESSFEVVDRQTEHLKNLVERFEQVVFTPLETSEDEIKDYLDGLFDTEPKKKSLRQMRHILQSRSAGFLDEDSPFDEATLKDCIKSLLKEDYLSEEKQTILQEFTKNDVVLQEIADVLNTRFADLKNWEWDAGEEGIPVLPRQQLNGKYRIWMDEDVLQAIFIHYIGIQSCMILKDALSGLVTRTGQADIWNWHTGCELTKEDIRRRAWFLGETPPGREPPCAAEGQINLRTRKNPAITYDERPTLKRRRKQDYIKHFFVTALPTRMDDADGVDYDEEGFDDEEPRDKGDWDYDDGTRKENEESHGNTKQFLLRKLATETLLQRALYGEAAVVQSDLKWFGAALSHTTIFAVMRFFGFPEDMISFFRKVLEAPLNISGSGPRTRRRGVPMARSPERLLGELVLFVMDFAVNQETGLLLYRLHDDLWVTGAPRSTAKAWETMKRVADVLGLEFNTHKTGSVYLVRDGEEHDESIASSLPEGQVRVGHLVLNPDSGKWIIDQKSVDEHVAQLRKQLAECRSVLDWIRTWNSCISRFFSNAFGAPAHCFGKQHVDSILATYQKIHHDIFAPWSDGSHDRRLSAVDYIKAKIQERFDVPELADCFIVLPDYLGGLGLENPFVPFLLKDEKRSPEWFMDDLLFSRERAEYDRLKGEYDALDISVRKKRALKAFEGFESSDVPQDDEFLGFDEYVAYREVTSAELEVTYRVLCARVSSRNFLLSRDASKYLNELRGTQFGSSFKGSRPEAKWVTQMYWDEIKAKYGGLPLVEPTWLPLGVITMMRKKAVRWGMVL